MAQPLPEWYRVHTFEDSFIELNTTLITAIDKDVTRVRFRWTFDQLQESKYKTKLEVMEFNCSQKRARTYHVTLLNAAGGIVRVDDTAGDWRSISSGGMLEKLAVPACDLVRKQTTGNAVELRNAELDKVAAFANEIGRKLEETKDFKAIVDQFFVADYLNNYLQDTKNQWFVLDRAIAATATHNDLERFYRALMNGGYVGTLYLISRTPADFQEHGSMENLKKLVSHDVWQLVANHPYTATYKRNQNGYDFLGEQIKDVEQLRSYTDLLEKTAALMRTHVKNVEGSTEYRETAETWNLYQPKIRVCGKQCWGLPAGTKLFEVNIPVFSLQIAEIKGELKVVSASYSFR